VIAISLTSSRATEGQGPDRSDATLARQWQQAHRQKVSLFADGCYLRECVTVEPTNALLPVFVPVRRMGTSNPLLPSHLDHRQNDLCQRVDGDRYFDTRHQNGVGLTRVFVGPYMVTAPGDEDNGNGFSKRFRRWRRAMERGKEGNTPESKMSGWRSCSFEIGGDIKQVWKNSLDRAKQKPSPSARDGRGEQQQQVSPPPADLSSQGTQGRAREESSSSALVTEPTRENNTAQPAATPGDASSSAGPQHLSSFTRSKAVSFQAPDNPEPAVSKHTILRCERVIAKIGWTSRSDLPPNLDGEIVRRFAVEWSDWQEVALVWRPGQVELWSDRVILFSPFLIHWFPCTNDF
jgi:hypothetical protein